MGEVKCPIWGTKAESPDVLGVYHEFNSERIGAAYRLTAGAAVEISKWNIADGSKRVALSQQIVEAATNGAVLLISEDDLTDGSAFLSPRSVSENLRLLIKVIQWQFPILGMDVYDYNLLSHDFPSTYAVAVGWHDPQFSSNTYQLLMKYFDAAQRRGLVHMGSASVTLTFEAFELIEEMSFSAKRSDSIFVAMWFGSKRTNRFFEEAIKPAIEGAGYRCVRIDQEEHNERIDEQILAEIRRSKAVLVDISCGLSKPINGWSKAEVVGAPRGGVYFEAGFAAGIGVPIIWTVDSAIAELENVIHFDIRQYNQIRWDDDFADARLRLQARIEATLGPAN